jgi:hypothetical protein
MFNQPKDSDKYSWTNHVKEKMIYYRISESLVKRVIRYPKRKEEGIAPKTIAVMISRESIIRKKDKSVKKIEEIWVMYQKTQNVNISTQGGSASGGKNQNNSLKFKLGDMIKFPKIRIISAWRYPGASPVGKKIPIPEDILQELETLVD